VRQLGTVCILGTLQGAILIKRPSGGDVGDDCVKIEERPLPETCPDGKAVVKVELLSIDPTHRIWMSTASQYMPSIGLNTVVRASGVGTVIMTSDEAKLPVGTKVTLPPFTHSLATHLSTLALEHLKAH
jgi:NADPH-dependent curcumin reductase CurA